MRLPGVPNSARGQNVDAGVRVLSMTLVQWPESI
jgi:hypothetical protein